jgi:hypothetical protein
MSLWRAVSLLSLFAVCAISRLPLAQAHDFKLQSLPVAMKYFNESKTCHVSEANQLKLESLAQDINLSIGQNPRFTLSQVLLFSPNFESVIFVTADRRANPDFLDHVYELEGGALTQVISNREQLAVYFYNVAPEIRETVIRRLSDPTAYASIVALVLPTANASELGRSSTSLRLQTTARQLGAATYNCAVDGVLKEGLYDPYMDYIGRPFARTVTATGSAIAHPRNALSSIVNEIREVPNFWRGEVERTRNVGNYLRSAYAQNLATAKKTSSKDIARTVCSFFAPIGTVGKLAKSGRLLELSAREASPLARGLSAASVKVEANVPTLSLKSVADHFTSAKTLIREDGNFGRVVADGKAHAGDYTITLTRGIDGKTHKVREQLTLVEGQTSPGHIGKIKTLRMDAEPYLPGHSFNAARVTIRPNGTVYLRPSAGFSQPGDLALIAEKLKAIGITPRFQ